MRAIQQLIDGWFERERDAQPRQYWARTRDGWSLALYRYRQRRGGRRAPVLLCRGMSSNRWDMDAPGRMSLARWLRRGGYDVWVVELRGAGRSTRPTWWNGKRYAWTFEDYVQHDAQQRVDMLNRTVRGRVQRLIDDTVRRRQGVIFSHYHDGPVARPSAGISP